MKRLKKIISVVLTLAFLIGCVSVIPTNASAARVADVNGDGKVNAKDSLVLRRHLAGLSPEMVEAAADINGDGDITSADGLLLRKHLVRMINIDLLPITDCYISSINLFGVDISNYQIVIPEEHDVYTQYAADLLNDYIDDKSGIDVPVVTDTETISNYEILIGRTNRPESIIAANSVTLEDDEYLLKADGTKLVMLGNSYMIGGGVGEFTYDYITYDSARKSQLCKITGIPTSDTPHKYTARQAKSAILLIGDGMGPNHAAATLYYNSNKHYEPTYDEFSATRLPVYCTCKTASLTTLISGGTTPTDSAAAGTALACGQKTNNGYVGLASTKRSMENIRELAERLGKTTGVMTTEPISGATPSCFTVHVESRNSIADIDAALAALTDIEYLKGNLLDDLLPETIKELDILSTNNDAGFFTMIEEAKIDTYSHAHDSKETTHAMARFNDCIRYCMTFAVAHPDTLLVITADHETGGPNSKLQFSTQSHTTANVPVFAIGHGSEKFTGVIENTLIPTTIAAEWGVKFPG